MRDIVFLALSIAACGHAPPKTGVTSEPPKARCELNLPGQRGAPQLFICEKEKCWTSPTLPLKSPLLFAVAGNWLMGFAEIEGTHEVTVLDPVFGIKTTTSMPVTFFRLSHGVQPAKPGALVGLFIRLFKTAPRSRRPGELIGDSCIGTVLVTPRAPEPEVPPEPRRRPWPHTI